MITFNFPFSDRRETLQNDRQSSRERLVHAGRANQAQLAHQTSSGQQRTSSPCSRSRRTAPSTTLSAIERPQVRHSGQSQQKHPGTPRRPFWPQTLPASTTAAATTTDTVRPPQHDSPQSSIRRNRFLGQRSAGVRSVQP